QRVIQAREPIGVPVGVPDALASAAPVTAPNASLQNQTQPPSAPVDSAKTQTATTDSTAIASQNEVSPQVQPAPVAPNETAPPTIAEAPVKNPSPAQTEPAPVISKAETEASITQNEPLPARAVAPEVRRAEPAPPSEGPEEAAAPSTHTEEPKVATKLRLKKNETVAKSLRKSKQEAETDEAEREDDPEASMPPLPRGSMRAKFVGVTPDGQWIMKLPSGKVV